MTHEACAVISADREGYSRYNLQRYFFPALACTHRSTVAVAIVRREAGGAEAPKGEAGLPARDAILPASPKRSARPSCWDAKAP